jgi:uncharacterized CHY-type Zn-finger protein
MVLPIVHGTLVDEQTRCTHYHSTLDIIAIKMKCCNKYYACIHCHNEAEKHAIEVWTKQEHNEKAILCGNCNNELTINTYLNCENVCPSCSSNFNPKCSNHYHFYFEV